MLQRGDPMCRHLGATMGQSVGTRNEWSRQSNGRDCFKCHPGRLPGIARIVPPMPHKRGVERNMLWRMDGQKRRHHGER